LQDNVAEELNQVADEKGVTRPVQGPAPDMTRDIADAVYARSKAAYASLDKATDGAFQPVADAISNINDELRDKLGLDPVQDAKLQTQKAALLKQQDALFDQAAENGVPKETVSNAKSDFTTAQSLYDTSNQLQMSALSDNPDLLNAKTLTNRLTKFNVTGDGGSAGRLEQAVGPDHAGNLIEPAKTSQFMSKLPVTEGKALTQLIQPNTSTSLFRGGVTDWGKTLKDFDALGSDGQKAQFKNPEAVRSFLKTRGRLVRLKQIGKYGAGLAATAGAGYLGYEAGH
jgi:hypothetical protein